MRSWFQWSPRQTELWKLLLGEFVMTSLLVSTVLRMTVLCNPLCNLYRGRRIQMSGHSDPRNFVSVGVSSIFDVSGSGYGIACLSSASSESGNNIHNFCGRHLGCRRTLFRKYSVWNVTSEYDTTFICSEHVLQP